MKRLRYLREQRGWTQSELGRRAKVNQGTVSILEAGIFRGYPKQLAKLARALGVPADKLLEDIDLIPTSATSARAQGAKR